MSYCPEPSLDPPEDIVIGVCCACEGNIYEGVEVWKNKYLFVCKEHMDDAAAEYFGFVNYDGME